MTRPGPGIAGLVLAAALGGMAPAHAHEPPGATSAASATTISAAAAPAAAVVDAFGAALLAGDRERVSDLLDPDVLILESGHAEHGRADYLAHHAGEDIAFLHGARITLTRRRADAADDLAVVASESTIHAQGKDGPVDLVSTETMVLHRGPQGWRITQVHWSSRRPSRTP